MIQVLAHRVILSHGWSRVGIALLAGLAAALSMPPLFLFPTLFLALPVAVWLLDGTEPGLGRLSLKGLWAAFRLGWCFGFGYFVGGFWWLGAAFFVESNEFLWALPLGVLGLPAGLALFHATAFLIARLLWSSGWRRILALSFALALMEYARGHILSGFPWNSFGQAFGATLPSLQLAAVVGLDGLTLGALLLGTAFAVLGTGMSRMGRWALPVVACLVIASIGAFGVLRLQAHGGWTVPTGATDIVPDVRLRLVQPNIAQREKNKPGASAPILKGYLALSDKATSPEMGGLVDVTHVIWPESPFPFLLASEPAALALIGDALPPNTTLITGAVRMEPGADRIFFNAMQVVASDGTISDSYDKTHLVPFGEYLPFEGLLRSWGLRQFVATPGGFSAGTVRKPLRVPGLPDVLPLICYEAIFDATFNGNFPRPGLLLNVTNDAWFGETFGPYQHFEQARMRSVETGLPMVRAANTGISAVIDPLGRVLRQLPLGVAGVVDSPLPVAASVTPYVTYGRAPFWVLLLVCLLGCIPKSHSKTL